MEKQAQVSKTDYIWDTLHGNNKKTSITGELLHENCRNVFFKNRRQVWTSLDRDHCGPSSTSSSCPHVMNFRLERLFAEQLALVLLQRCEFSRQLLI